MTGADIRQVAENAKRATILAEHTEIDLIDLLRRIIRIQSPQLLADEADLSSSLLELRTINEKVFTFRRLAEMFNISVGHVSNMLKKAKEKGLSDGK